PQPSLLGLRFVFSETRASLLLPLMLRQRPRALLCATGNRSFQTATLAVGLAVCFFGNEGVAHSP
ncbi:MAG: hypothetical protein RSB39_07755, partial [Oscillospiraceae bacterium]